MKEQFFKGLIRFVFLFAYGAFLWASIHHIAYFFHDFEQSGNNWIGPYALAMSIDTTSLVLTIGLMFFVKTMPKHAVICVALFIVFLTAFSWIVNWEYAARFQNSDLTNNPTLVLLNPVLASSFAFLNLAYALVAEFFSTKVQTADELKAEADRVEELEIQQQRLDAYRQRNKKAGVIQQLKETAIETKQAFHEVIQSTENAPRLEAPEETVLAPEAPSDMPTEQEKDTDTLPVVEPQKEPLRVEKANSIPNRGTRGSKPLQRRSVSKQKRGRGDAIELVREVLLADRNASLTDIVKRTGVSRSRVSEIRTAILQEWQEKTNSLSNGHASRLDMDNLVPLEV